MKSPLSKRNNPEYMQIDHVLYRLFIFLRFLPLRLVSSFDNVRLIQHIYPIYSIISSYVV